MCHEIALASRLDRDPYTVPLAELLLTKLQIVELTARDQGDLYTLCYHHPVVDHPSAAGIEATVIAQACGADWGLWRTCTQSIERCLADVARHDLPSERSRSSPLVCSNSESASRHSRRAVPGGGAADSVTASAGIASRRSPSRWHLQPAALTPAVSVACLPQTSISCRHGPAQTTDKPSR